MASEQQQELIHADPTNVIARFQISDAITLILYRDGWGAIEGRTEDGVAYLVFTAQTFYRLRQVLLATQPPLV